MKRLFGLDLSKLKFKAGIYLIKINTRLYIGSTYDFYDRLTNHKYKLKSNTHQNEFVQNMFNKYGQSECYYTILETVPNHTNLMDLLILEKNWIDFFNPDLNIIKDPTTTYNCSTTSRVVYRYSLSGDYIDEFKSVSEAGRSLNLDKGAIAQAARNTTKLKSCGQFQWSYTKVVKLPRYKNNSSKSRLKQVTMYNIEGNKLKRFKSIADAARYIMVSEDNFDALCASISGVASGKGKLIKNKYRFSYKDLDKLDKLQLLRNLPIQQITNGVVVNWNSAIEASKKLKFNAAGIRRVLTGERKTYKKSKWKFL